MANITLKDRDGNPVAYDDVQEIVLPTAEGRQCVFSELPELKEPAACGDVLTGKEFLDENGTVQRGSIPVCGEGSVTFEQVDESLRVKIEAGYYPDMEVFHNVGNTGGNAILQPVPVTLTEGGTVAGMDFSSLGFLLSAWHDFLQYLTGADMYYMPITVALQINDTQIPIEGAVLIPDISENSAIYSGSSVDGSAAFSVTYIGEEDDTLTAKNISVTVGGVSVPIPEEGITGVMLLTIPYDI